MRWSIAPIVVATLLLARPSDAQIQAGMWGGAGGEQADIFARPDESATIYVGIFNGSTPVPNLTFTVTGWGVYSHEGGHAHSGWGWGGFTTNSGTTGPNGEFAAFTYQAGPAAGMMWPNLEFFYLGQWWFITTVNGLILGISASDLPWIGDGDFIRIGSTNSHPDNHYGEGWFLNALRGLATDYRNQFPNLDVLAYNDSSLRRGGIFDLNSNYSPPHHEHRLGLSQDVRANNAPNAIPHDPVVRDWFEERVRQIFGIPPLLESAGTSNEHYHIRG